MHTKFRYIGLLSDLVDPNPKMPHASLNCGIKFKKSDLSDLLSVPCLNYYLINKIIPLYVTLHVSQFIFWGLHELLICYTVSDEKRKTELNLYKEFISICKSATIFDTMEILRFNLFLSP